MEGDATEVYIRERIEQFMGKDWMDAHREQFTVDIFDDFVAGSVPRPAQTLNLNMSFCGLSVLARIAVLAETYGSLLITNCSCPASGPGSALLIVGRDLDKLPEAFKALEEKEGTPA